MKHRIIKSKRILALFLGLTLTFSGNVSAFAVENIAIAENEIIPESEQEEIIADYENTDELERVNDLSVVSDAVEIVSANELTDDSCINGAWVDDIVIDSISEELGSISSKKAVRTLLEAEEITGATSSFPDKYSSYDKTLVNPARDQRYGTDDGSYNEGVNTCWAFSTATAIETNMIKKGLLYRATKRISPGALGYFRYNSSAGGDENLLGCSNGLAEGYDYINTGGNTVHAALMLSNQAGLMSEDRAKYSSETAREYNREYEYDSDMGYITNSYWMRADYEDRDYIKELVTQYGAVTVNIYLVPSRIRSGGGYKALYYTADKSKSVGHTVTIIGWDDTISKDAFMEATGSKPSIDGGWLVMDSYGLDAPRDNGMFYISYDDAMLNKASGNSNKAIAYDVKRTAYDNIYQYDGVYLGTYYKQDENKVTAANIFTADSNDAGNEEIKAVSFSTYTVNADYNIKIYSDLLSNNNPESGYLIYEGAGSFLYAGVHTINLDKKVIIPDGQRYSVVVEISKNGELCDLLFSSSYNKDVLRSTQKVEAGRSFYLNDNKWEDASEAISVKGSNDEIAGVFRIKAYTNNTDEEVTTVANLSEDNVQLIPDQAYTGSEIRPDPVVYYNKRELKKGVDYRLSYSNNISVGTATILIKGMGEFAGSDSVTVKFQIVRRNVNSLSVNGLVDERGRDKIFLYTGAQIRPVTLTYFDGKNTVDLTEEAVISYSNNVKAGTAKVTIKGVGNLSGELIKTFTINKRDLRDAEIVYSDIDTNDFLKKSFVYEYEEIKPSLEIYNVASGSLVMLNEDRDYVKKFEYNRYPGIATIHLTPAKNSSYVGEKTLYFNIVKKDITSLDIEIEKVSYTGEPLCPNVTIRDGSKTLRNTVDYFLKYENNVDSGTGKVTITAVDYSAYQGSIEKSFTIEKVDLSGAVMENISNFNCAKDGDRFEQDSMAVRLGDKYLLEGRDYEVIYTNNVGKIAVDTTASVKINGINHYTGSKTASFTIFKAASAKYVRLDDFSNKNLTVQLLTDGQSAHEMIYTGKQRKPVVKVSYKGTELKENEDYELIYSADIVNKGTAYVDIVAATNSDKYLGSRRMYYYIIGRPINGEGTVDGGFSIVPPKDVVYDGRMNESPVVIKYLGKRLKEGRDYTLTYYNNSAVTKNAKVVITGIGDYSKTLSYTYAILPLDLSKVKLSRIPKMTYTGEEICPDQKLIIKKSNVLLMPDLEYSRKYENNIDAGKAYITYEPKTDNFTGSLKVTFNIAPKKVSSFVRDIDILGIEKGYYATGDKITPSVKVYYNDREVISTAISRPADIYVKYGNNIMPGKGKVEIRALGRNKGGSGNYSGTKIIKFDIIGKEFNADWGTSVPWEEYTGKQLKPDVEGLHVVDIDGKDLEQGRDYSVKYVKNVAGSKYGEISIRGKRLYKNQTATLQYDIIPMIVTEDILKISSIKDQRYIGLPVRPELTIKVKKRKLKLGRDYIVSYKDNKKVGEAKAIISFIGNYEGFVTETFNIIY